MRIDRRTAARGLLVTPSRSLLLLHMELPWLGNVWMVPGGGAEQGESLPETAAREVHEETGLPDAPVGPEVWRRSVRMDFADRRLHLREHYFLIEVAEFEPSRGLLEEYESRWLLEYRWWPAHEIARSRERFAPAELGVRIAQLLDDGPPDAAHELAPQVHDARSYVPEDAD